VGVVNLRGREQMAWGQGPECPTERPRPSSRRGGQAVRPALSLEPDIVITDIRLPASLGLCPFTEVSSPRLDSPDCHYHPASLVRENQKRMVALEGAVGSLFDHQALRKENP
jgi:hypothetical protein